MYARRLLFLRDATAFDINENHFPHSSVDLISISQSVSFLCAQIRHCCAASAAEQLNNFVQSPSIDSKDDAWCCYTKQWIPPSSSPMHQIESGCSLRGLLKAQKSNAAARARDEEREQCLVKLLRSAQKKSLKDCIIMRPKKLIKRAQALL